MLLSGGGGCLVVERVWWRGCLVVEVVFIGGGGCLVLEGGVV